MPADRHTHDPRPPAPAWQTALGAGLALLSALAMVASLISRDWRFVIWSDRDLVRSIVPWSELPTAGAELSFGPGARIPGGAEYAVLKAAWSVLPEPGFVWQAQCALDLVAVLLIGLTGWRAWGPLAGGGAMALYVFNPAHAVVTGTLWNAGLSPLFVAVVLLLAARMAEDRATRQLPAFALFAGLGAQMHLSVLPVAGALLLMLATLRPRLRGVDALGAVGALALAYAPYLWTEARAGWPNTRLLAQHSAWVTGVPRDVHAHGWVERVGHMLGSYGAALLPRSAPAHVPDALAAGVVIAPIAIALATFVAFAAMALRRSLSARERTAWVVSGPFVLVSVQFYLDGELHFVDATGTKYLLALLPSLALTAAAGLAWLSSIRPTAGAVGWGLVAVFTAVAAPAWTHERVWWSQSDLERGDGYDRARARLAVVQAETGWTLAEVIGRTTAYDASYNVDGRQGVALMLALEGEQVPGTLPPPCALLSRSPQEPAARPFAELTEQITGAALPELALLDEHALADGTVLHLYQHTGGPCHASFHNRYVPTEEESLLRAAMWAPDAHEVVSVQGTAPGQLRARLPLSDRPASGSAPPALALLVLTPTAGQLHAELHANQLRGLAWYDGLFASLVLHSSHLVLEPAVGEAIAWPLNTSPIGGRHPAGPLRVGPRALASGTYTVRLVAELGPYQPTTRPQPTPPQRREWALTEALTVP